MSRHVSAPRQCLPSAPAPEPLRAQPPCLCPRRAFLVTPNSTGPRGVVGIRDGLRGGKSALSGVRSWTNPSLNISSSSAERPFPLFPCGVGLRVRAAPGGDVLQACGEWEPCWIIEVVWILCLCPPGSLH